MRLGRSLTRPGSHSPRDIDGELALSGSGRSGTTSTANRPTTLATITDVGPPNPIKFGPHAAHGNRVEERRFQHAKGREAGQVSVSRQAGELQAAWGLRELSTGVEAEDVEQYVASADSVVDADGA